MHLTKPVIPANEYPVRWNAIRKMMTELSLDYFVAYADDHAVAGPAHVRWLAGFPAHFEPALVVIGQSGEPMLLVGPESPEYARLHSAIKEIRILREFTHPDEDYPHTRIQSFAEIAGELSGSRGKKRIGLAGGGLMSAAVYASLTTALPGEWIDVDSKTVGLRAIKTPSEIAVISYAYTLAEAGLAAAVAAVREGAVEREVAAEAEYVMRKMGAEGLGIDTFVASGFNSSPIIARTTFREMRRGDAVLLTLAPRYEGYHAAIGMPVFLGDVHPEAKRAAKAALAAQRYCASALKPGVGCEVEGEARRIMAQAGMGDLFLYSGIHGVGVIEFEPPIFGPSSRETVQENMVLSVDIPVFGAAWGGLRLEDGYLIEKNGAKRLTSFSYPDW